MHSGTPCSRFSNSPETERLAQLTLLLDALRSTRTLSVALLSFASGLPLGLVWYAIPDTFVVLYKLGDQLTQSLTRPFLIDMGYDAVNRGIALATLSVVFTVLGTFAGGLVTTLAGLGHALWIFGVLQILSNAGYFLLALLDRPKLVAMYGATGFEVFASGLASAWFVDRWSRRTDQLFSETQYAPFSILVALPRLFAGPITGFTVNALGWPSFFLLTMVLAFPGLVMLARFVPIGVREPAL